MAIISNFVKETTSTTGTGTYSLSGAVAGSQGFVAGVGSGNTTMYSCTDGANWEVGYGVVTSGSPNTLTRNVIASSNSNAAVAWSAGVKSIFCAIPGQRSVFANENNTALQGVPNNAITSAMLASGLSLTGNVTVAGTFTAANSSPAYLAVTGGTTTVNVTAAGTSNSNILVGAFGTGQVIFQTGGGVQAVVNNTASASNYLSLTGSNGGAPSIGSTGGNVAFFPNTANAYSPLEVGPVVAGAATAGAGLIQRYNANTNKEIGRLDFVLTNGTNGSEAADLRFYTVNAGARTLGMTLQSAGVLFVGGTTVPTNSPRVGFIASSGGFSAAFTDNVNNSLYISHSAGGALISTDSGGALRFATNGTTVALTLNSSQLATFTGPVVTASYTVAGLPSAATAGAGARAFVTDANATTFASTVAAGGSNKVPVYSDGANWKIG